MFVCGFGDIEPLREPYHKNDNDGCISSLPYVKRREFREFLSQKTWSIVQKIQVKKKGFDDRVREKLLDLWCPASYKVFRENTVWYLGKTGSEHSRENHCSLLPRKAACLGFESIFQPHEVLMPSPHSPNKNFLNSFLSFLLALSPDALEMVGKREQRS